MHHHMFTGTVETELDADEWKEAILSSFKDEGEKGTLKITSTTESEEDEEEEDPEFPDDDEKPEVDGET